MAAREAGPSQSKPRDIAVRLGVAVEQLPRMGLTYPERLPAGYAKELMAHIRDLTHERRWPDLAAIIGWDHTDPRLADRARRDDTDDED